MISLLLAACSSPAPTVAPDPTWIDELGEDLDAFEALLDRDGRESWIALHAGRPEEAWSSMKTEAGRHRAAHEVRSVYDTLSAIHRSAVQELVEGWPDAPAELRVAADWAKSCEQRPDNPVLAARFDARSTEPQEGAAPLWTLEEAGFTRVIQDPCREWATARAWATREGAVDGLAAVVFGPIDFTGSGVRTAQGARDDLLELRRTLERGTAARSDEAGVLASLDVDEIARTRTTVALASQALEDGDAEYARVLLQLARPADRTVVSASTPPRFHAELARAELASGNPRGALDSLAALGHRADGVRETVADLAVLRGLSRVGDSKEE